MRLLQPSFGEEELGSYRAPRAPAPPAPARRPAPSARRRPVRRDCTVPRLIHTCGDSASRRRRKVVRGLPTAAETDGIDLAAISFTTESAPLTGGSVRSVLGRLVLRCVAARGLQRIQCDLPPFSTVVPERADVLLSENGSPARLSVGAVFAYPRRHCGRMWWTLQPPVPGISLTLLLLVPAGGGDPWILPAPRDDSVLPCDAIDDPSACGGSFAKLASTAVHSSDVHGLGRLLTTAIRRNRSEWAKCSAPSALRPQSFRWW
eukprot:TRINITY_DN39571_c0_g1_i1.p2 TRINITY_DN39571_c0_g1~~TRINITY_DN39571_c0_g1_i1.p2  ORF type:complete len:262 (+),score=67.89 TRINITY_DN39571_c0_g1_i1:41-826(+)